MDVGIVRTPMRGRHSLKELIEMNIEALKDGVIANCPRDELPALLYAQHWAETRGRIEPGTRERIIEIYDEGTVKAIDLTLQTIQMGNLLGNTIDYILYRLSFGRLGMSPNVNGI
jgi:hypothetical protein